MTFVSDHFTRDGIPPLPVGEMTIPQRPQGTTFVKFRESARPTGRTDESTGLPEYTRHEIIEIHIPGDKNSVVHQRVTPGIKRVYAKEYEAYRQGKEYEGDGLPLSKWAGIPIEQIEGLRHLKIYTVEALGGLSDAQCGNLMGLRALREKARLFLESAKSSAPLMRLSEENEALKNKQALMEVQMAELLSLVKDMKRDGGESEPQKRAPGRPRKNEQESE